MGESTGNHTTTLEQRRTLVAAYQRTNNMAAAAREAGIRSRRTAYLWWGRFKAKGEAGLEPRSRARKSQRTVPDDVAAAATSLRQDHPEWGRRRIARELQTLFGEPVVSPSGVQAVLSRSGLWAPARVVAPQLASNLVLPFRAEFSALDSLLPLAVAGIEASLRSDAARSVAILGGEVWRQLGGDRPAWSRLLGDPVVGPLLLRSRVELGRSLMNTGQSRASARVLEETLGWLRRAEPRRGSEDHPDPWLGIRLRRHDAWIETYQYLGILPKGPESTYAPGYLTIALAAITASSPRLAPMHPALMVGNLERDLARQLLRDETTPDADVERRLDTSRSSLEETGDRAMLAATDMVSARFRSRQARRARDEEKGAWAAAVAAMEALTERALAVFDTMDSPMLHANFLIDTARLAGGHGLPVDERRLRRAADLCLTFGYGGQARQLVNVPRIDTVLPPDILRALSGIAHGPTSRHAHPNREAWED